jgi:hypothetical protein
MIVAKVLMKGIYTYIPVLTVKGLGLRRARKVGEFAPPSLLMEVYKEIGETLELFTGLNAFNKKGSFGGSGSILTDL